MPGSNLLPVMLNHVMMVQFSSINEFVCENPVKIFVHGKGYIKEDYDADFTIVI